MTYSVLQAQSQVSTNSSASRSPDGLLPVGTDIDEAERYVEMYPGDGTLDDISREFREQFGADNI